MAVYHLKAGIGSRGGGQSAAAKNAYICREGRYAGDSDEVLYREDGNMPQWAQAEPGHYWQAADDGERANGSLYREVQFALPKELSEDEQVDLARDFAKSLTNKRERLPYTLAIHRGASREPDKPNNPHCHLVISERVNDGQGRSAETWFKRHNRQSPEKGGARKSRAAMPREWLTNTRQEWERRANQALERSGSPARIDRRSWAERREDAMKRGDLEEAARCSREPNVHLGPREYRHQDGKEQKDQRVKGENAAATTARDSSADEITEQKTAIERIEQELQRLGEEIKRLAKRVVELAKESLEIERQAAQRREVKRPAEPEPNTVEVLLRERQRIWKLEDAAQGAPNQYQLEYEATQASNALWDRVTELPWKERDEYERQEAELERQQGRDGGMSR